MDIFLAKAYIRVINDCTCNGIDFKSKDKILVQFNPESYSMNYGAQYDFELKGKFMYAQYKGQISRQLNLKLFFDMLTENVLISKVSNALLPNAASGVQGLVNASLGLPSLNEVYIEKILALSKPNENGCPPLIEFNWSSQIIKGVISNTSLDYTLFDNMGEPVRATIDLTINECDFVEIGETCNQQKMSTPPANKKSAITKDQFKNMSQQQLQESLLMIKKLL